MLDKLEAPNIPDSYGISVAYAILLDITRSIGGVIQRTPEVVSCYHLASVELMCFN